MELGLRLLLIAIVFTVLSSCERDGCDIELAADQIRLSDRVTQSGIEYFLYTRTAGWHEKIVYFELYNVDPKFDNCRKTNVEPIYVEPFNDYPDIQYVKSLALQPDQPQKLLITYTQNESEGIRNIYEVKFSNDDDID